MGMQQSERGPLAVKLMVGMLAEYDLNHSEQLERITETPVIAY